MPYHSKIIYISLCERGDWQTRSKSHQTAAASKREIKISIPKPLALVGKCYGETMHGEIK